MLINNIPEVKAIKINYYSIFLLFFKKKLTHKPLNKSNYSWHKNQYNSVYLKYYLKINPINIVKFRKTNNLVESHTLNNLSTLIGYWKLYLSFYYNIFFYSIKNYFMGNENLSLENKSLNNLTYSSKSTYINHQFLTRRSDTSPKSKKFISFMRFTRTRIITVTDFRLHLNTIFFLKKLGFIVSSIIPVNKCSTAPDIILPSSGNNTIVSYFFIKLMTSIKKKTSSKKYSKLLTLV